MTTFLNRPALDSWPGLAPVRPGLRTTISAAVARRLFLAAIGRFPVSVHLDGRVLGTGGPEMTIHRPDEFFERLGRDLLIGFGEAYLTGAWDAEDLGGFLTVLASDVSTLVPPGLQRLRALAVRRPPRRERSTRANSQHNIAHHYDLSNDLFELFLDPGLSYSAAMFAGAGPTASPCSHGETALPTVSSPWEVELHHVNMVKPGRLAAPEPGGDLYAAQTRKIERLLDRTGVVPGTRVLEIGTGWGELAIRAAQRGATVHTITLSTEQKALAERRIEARGLTDLVSVELLDYRDLVLGTTHLAAYDAVLSVEMIEAVGHDFWDDYFSILDRVLAPGGRVGIQAITMRHDRMLATRNTYTWINKYIFPGGFLPSVEVIDQITRRHTTLRITDRLAFGSHYAETLRQWDARFLAARDQVLALGFDETFIRMWHFYLDYSRAGFGAGYIDVNQLVLDRGDHGGRG